MATRTSVASTHESGLKALAKRHPLISMVGLLAPIAEEICFCGYPC